MRSYDAEIDELLTDLVFSTNYSFAEIARDLDVSESWARKRVKELGLGWVRRSKGCASRGQAALTAIIRKLLPGEIVISEHAIGERLFLDVYCPKYQVAAEYHGQQHFQFNPFFHEDAWDFEQSQRRDLRKMELCADLGINLIVFRYNDELTEQAVFDRLLEAVENGYPKEEPQKESKYKGNAFYESYKQRQREYRKLQYRKMRKSDGTRRTSG